MMGRVPVGERRGARRGRGDGGPAASVRVGVQEARLSPAPWGRRAASTAPHGGCLPAVAARWAGGAWEHVGGGRRRHLPGALLMDAALPECRPSPRQ